MKRHAIDQPELLEADALVSDAGGDLIAQQLESNVVHCGGT